MCASSACWMWRSCISSLVLDLLKQCDVVIPGDLCKHLLHKCLVGVAEGKRSHVFEITSGKPLHLWKRGVQIVGTGGRSLLRPSLSAAGALKCLGQSASTGK